MPECAATGFATSVTHARAANAAETCQRRPTQTLGVTTAPSRRARDLPARERECVVPECAPTGLATSVPQTRAANAAEAWQGRPTQTLGATTAPSRHARGLIGGVLRQGIFSFQFQGQASFSTSKPFCSKHQGGL